MIQKLLLHWNIKVEDKANDIRQMKAVEVTHYNSEVNITINLAYHHLDKERGYNIRFGPSIDRHVQNRS